MRLIEGHDKVNLLVNNKNIKCSCNSDVFGVQLFLINCEKGYREYLTECSCCGKIERYNYSVAKKNMQIIKLR